LEILSDHITTIAIQGYFIGILVVDWPALPLLVGSSSSSGSVGIGWSSGLCTAQPVVVSRDLSSLGITNEVLIQLAH